MFALCNGSSASHVERRAGTRRGTGARRGSASWVFAVGRHLEPAVEVEEVLRAVLRGEGRGPVREAPRGARLRVPPGLEPAPLRGLVAAPRDAERRQRQQQRGGDLEPPFARRRRFAGLAAARGARGRGRVRAWTEITTELCPVRSPSVSGACCIPAGEARRPASAARSPSMPPGAGAHPARSSRSPAGAFRMGDDSVWAYPGDGEGPVHEVTLDAFRIDRYAVTNDELRRRSSTRPARDRRRALRLVVRVRRPAARRLPRHRAVVEARVVAAGHGADWRHPRVRSPDLDGRGRPPGGPRVVERRAGVLPVDRGPASRPRPSGSARRVAVGRCAFPWGDELEPDGEHRMNVFQGTFPGENSAATVTSPPPGRRLRAQ